MPFWLAIDVTTQEVSAKTDENPEQNPADGARIAADGAGVIGIADKPSSRLATSLILGDALDTNEAGREKRDNDATGEVAEQLNGKFDDRFQDELADGFKWHRLRRVMAGAAAIPLHRDPYGSSRHDYANKLDMRQVRER